MTVPAAVLALLQKQSMIGADKPTHEITVEGMATGYNWLDTTVAYDPDTSDANTHASYAILSDGSILYMYSRGGSIYQAFAPNLNTFLSSNNTVTGEAEVLGSNFDTPRATVFFAPDGELYFVVAWTADNDVSPLVATVRLYHSSIGDGSDWVLKSTLQNYDHVGGVLSASQRTNVGIPYFDEDGRWLLPAPIFRTTLNTSSMVTIWRTSDNGTTWGNSGEMGATRPHSGAARNIVFFDGYYWALLPGAINNDDFRIYSSADGETWAQVFAQAGAAYGRVMLIASDDEKLWARVGGSDNLWSTASAPTQWSDFEDTGITLPTNFGDGATGFFEHQGSLLGVTGQYVAGFEIETDSISAKSISISRNKGQASGLTVTFDNKDGRLSPDKAEFNKILWPGNQIEIKQGYGSSLIETFTGLIDKVGMASFPQEIHVGARDMLKKALDQIITTSLDGHVLHFDDELIEDIFTTLCGLGGITYGTVEETTIRLTHTFRWETYADAFQLLADIAYFNVTADEYGVLHFKEFSTRQPEHTQSVTLDDDGGAQPWYTLEKAPGVLRSEIVTDPTETTTYEREVDYEVEYLPMRIKRIDGGLIADGATVVVKYVYPAHIFKEGVDLIRTQMDIGDEGLYAKVIVTGKGDDDVAINAESVFGSAAFFGVHPQKILPVHLGRDGNTLAKCENVAQRAIANITTKSRVISFAAVAVPWLTSGDRIQIVEVSAFGPEYTEPIFGDLLTGIGLVYTITDLSFSQSASGYTMTGEAFFSGYAPQPGV